VDAARTAGEEVRRSVGERAHPLLLGMVLFLASELMFFGALFAAYFTLRVSAPAWPPPGVELEAFRTLVATVVLVSSSLTMQLAVLRARSGDAIGMTRWVAVTAVLGAGFLANQLAEYASATFSMGDHPYGSMFFTMTGAHGLHVLVGLGLMTVVLGRVRQGAYRGGAIEGPEAVAYYWHFVDAVWVALFLVLYVLK
jgi:cytochrome c oxidase subunit 3